MCFVESKLTKTNRPIKDGLNRCCTSCIQNMCQIFLFFCLWYIPFNTATAYYFYAMNFSCIHTHTETGSILFSGFIISMGFIQHLFRLWCWWMHSNFSWQSRFWRSRFLVINWNLFIFLLRFSVPYRPINNEICTHLFWSFCCFTRTRLSITNN